MPERNINCDFRLLPKIRRATHDWLHKRAIAGRVLSLMLISVLIAALVALAGMLGAVGRRRIFHFDVGPVSQNWLVTKRLQDERLETRLWT